MAKLKWSMRACGFLLLWATAAIALPAQTFTSLYNFCSQSACTDGSFPYGELVQATDGNLYGTTGSGGAIGGGTVFRLTQDGTLSTFYSFCSHRAHGYCLDGAGPAGALVQATDGNFYGATELGGFLGLGSIFKLTPNGTLTSLYSFCLGQSDCPEGQLPEAGLIQGADRNFYGTTQYYGGPSHNGTVFRITPNGEFTNLHSFDKQTGDQIHAGLVQGNDGNFYGTTMDGGVADEGTIFKITPGGTLTILHKFHQTGAAQPAAGLIQASDGNFYGTTSTGGANSNSRGTIFRMTPSGTLTVLYSFCSLSNCADGLYPVSSLIQATNGNFYGTTSLGGSSNACLAGCGTVFEFSLSSGTLTTLHSFEGVDGQAPVAALVQATNGNIYGTTPYGGNRCGSEDCGTLFELSMGLGPFVETNPAVGAVGTPVKILGTNLTGATSVTFNGIAATFTVVSSTEIATTVPAGVTTGKVQVVTPAGTLTSNVNFHVLP